MGGINLWGTLYCVLVPLTVFTATTRLLPESGQDHHILKVLAHVLPIILLAVLWTSQYDRHLFIDLRDHLLFSNSAGKKVSDFYYKYSPHATEAFKSINQKTLKTCQLPQLSDPRIARTLKLKLLQLDYLPVDSDLPVDLEIVLADNQLLMKSDGRVIMETAIADVLDHTKQILHQFSIDTDRFAALRQLTFLALLFGYPLTLYILFHGLFWLISLIFTDRHKAAAVATVICLTISVAILVIFSFSRTSPIEKNKLAESLNSDSWQERVAALRFIEEQGLEIMHYNSYLQKLSGLDVPERYWIAKAMAKSNVPETHEILLQLLNDPSVNVESMALWALARRGQKQALPVILVALKISDRWYSQIYAYNALRKLGWKQNQSN